MDEYDTLEKVQALFNGMTPGEEWEGFFLAKDDFWRDPNQLGGRQPFAYTELLFAIGKNGVAFFPVMQKWRFSHDPRNWRIKKDKYIYMPNNMIDKVEIKKCLIGSNLKLKMRFMNNSLFFLVVCKEKNLPYQEAGKAVLLKRFEK